MFPRRVDIPRRAAPTAGRAWLRWTAAALLALVPASAAFALPERFSARYVLSAQGVDIGKTHWTLAPLGDGRFAYESRSEAIGLARLLRDERIDERSVWRLADGSVQPLRYTYNRSGGKRVRNVEVEFDWQDGRVRNTLNGQTWSMPIEAGMLDKLVYLLALMNDLAAERREVRYAVADGGKVKTYLLRVVGRERVDTVKGSLEATVVERRREGDERETRIWCAPALGYLPVRVEHREDGEVVRLELESLEGL